MISVPDLAWGSVVGNTLERGFGYTAHGEHAAVQCGLEVVVADGDVVRTGMRAMDGCRSWTLYRGAFGPSLEGLFSQSNLGIVTKMDRSHLDHMDLAAEQYRFGDHAAAAAGTPQRRP